MAGNNRTQVAKMDFMITGLKDIIRKGQLGRKDMDKIQIALEHAEKGRDFYIAGNMDKSGLHMSIAYDFMAEVIRTSA